MEKKINGTQYIREMLSKIRRLTENENKTEIDVPIDAKFGSTVNSLLSKVKEQLSNSNLDFGNHPLVFYPKTNDISMTFLIKDMNNMVVQFRLNDANGQGCYISSNETQLTDDNTKKIQRIKYAFDSWKESILQDDTFIRDLKNNLV